MYTKLIDKYHDQFGTSEIGSEYTQHYTTKQFMKSRIVVYIYSIQNQDIDAFEITIQKESKKMKTFELSKRLSTGS